MADVPFSAAIVGNVVTVTPNANLSATTMFELKFDVSKVLRTDSQGKVNGANYV